MAKKQSWEEKKERINKITEEMDNQVNSYFETPEQMKEYLSFMAKFYNYSPRNTALIHGQFRGAKAVGSFKFWKDKGFAVQKGEKGIQVLVPNKTVPKFKNEKGKWNNIKYATKQERELIKQGVLEERKSKLYFSLGHVFDISQTNAKTSDLPEIFPGKWLEGEVADYNLIMGSLNDIASDLGVTVGSPLEELGSAKGAFYHAVEKEGTIGHIGLNPRNSELQNVKTMIHELAHAKLHSGTKAVELSAEEKEFQAEMVAYATASYFGIDTSDYSLGYLAGWTKGKDLKDKSQLLSEIRETSVEFVTSIEKDLIKNKEVEQENKVSKEVEKSSSVNEPEKHLLIKYDGLVMTENEYVSIDELRHMVSNEKTRILTVSNNSNVSLDGDQKDFIDSANQLMADEDLTPKEWSEIFNQMFYERYTVIDSETLHKPTVLIQWSEAWEEKNVVLPLKEANNMMERRIEEIEKAKAMAKEGQYVPYEKTRYHVLLPNDEGKVDVINMDRLDMGDGEFQSPYEQIMEDIKLSDSQKEMIKGELGMDNEVPKKELVTEEAEPLKDIEIVGNDEYGETAYQISEMVGNYSRETIVYGYDPEAALDNYVEHGEEKYGWQPDEQEQEGNVYFAKGYFPLDLDNLAIVVADKEYVNEVRKNNQLLRKSRQGIEMEM